MMLGKRRALADEEAERGCLSHHTHNPQSISSHPQKHQHQGEGKNISTPPPATGSTAKEPATTHCPGCLKEVMPAASSSQRSNISLRCVSFGITASLTPDMPAILAAGERKVVSMRVITREVNSPHSLPLPLPAQCL